MTATGQENNGATIMNLSKDEKFFYESAGIVCNPATGETVEHGAQRYANAEAQARDAGFSFHWEFDPSSDSSEFSDETPAWEVWQCVAYDGGGCVVASLHGIDFGRDGAPWGNAYRRVVEAELAIEALHTVASETLKAQKG